MHDLVILSRLEEEHLVRAIEAGVDVQRLRQMFMWCQGALRALLPHGIMVCVYLGESDRVVHIECLNSLHREPAELQRLTDTEDGLAVRLVRRCRDHRRLAWRIDPQTPATDPLLADLVRLRLGNALVQGTEMLQGGASYFVLFEFTPAPTARHEFFLQLLLPYLHLALLRVIASRGSSPAAPGAGQAKLTDREIEVLSWVFKGKTNPEIGLILGLSALTVKNHLRNIFRKLGVGNRVQALARCHDLQLLPKAPGAETTTSPAPALARLA